MVDGKEFLFISRADESLYLDVEGRNVVVRNRDKSRRTQIWYFDAKSRTFKNKSNNQSLDIEGSRTNLIVYPTHSGANQVFAFQN